MPGSRQCCQVLRNESDCERPALSTPVNDAVARAAGEGSRPMLAAQGSSVVPVSDVLSLQASGGNVVGPAGGSCSAVRTNVQ